MSSPADPPPDALAWVGDPAVPGVLFGGDERIGVSIEEFKAIATLIELEHLEGLTLLTLREGSPWLELDVAVVPMRRYALWRYTCAWYRIGSDGAVEDDPIWRPPA